jgi:hypothetical protein
MKDLRRRYQILAAALRVNGIYRAKIEASFASTMSGTTGAKSAGRDAQTDERVAIREQPSCMAALN